MLKDARDYPSVAAAKAAGACDQRLPALFFKYCAQSNALSPPGMA